MLQGNAGKSQTSYDENHDGASDTAERVRTIMDVAVAQKLHQAVTECIQAAADNDCKQVARVLDEQEVHVDDLDRHGRTSLHLACSAGHLDMVRYWYPRACSTE